MEFKTVPALAEALAKAQGEIKAPLKKCKVDFVNTKGQRVCYSYADLADVIEAIRIPLSKNGLSILHQVSFNENGYGLTTTLLHATGEFVSTWYPLPDPTQLKPQEFGSSLTYARRYSVTLVTGVASDEDDDASEAVAPKPPTPKPKANTIKPHDAQEVSRAINPAIMAAITKDPPKVKLDQVFNALKEPSFDSMPDYEGTVFESGEADKVKPPPLIQQLMWLAEEKNLGPEKVKEIIARVCGAKKHSSEMTDDELERTIKFVKNYVTPKKTE